MTASGARDQRTVGLWLDRLTKGECSSADVDPLARAAGFPTFIDLCQAVLPERLPRLSIRPRAVRARIEGALAGKTSLAELRSWAELLHAIAFRHVLGKNRAERRITGEALALAAVAADDLIFKTREPVDRVLSAIAAALATGETVATAELYRSLFVGQAELHLAARRPFAADVDPGADPFVAPGEAPDASWADVVARTSAGRVSTTDPSAIVAFAVVTEEAVSGDRLGYGCPLPALLVEARRAAPNFAIGRYRPRIFRDVDGILEIVLRTPEIDQEALAYATKLFALIHRLGRVTLDGVRLSTLRVALV
jgi:hypothetical protein